MAFDSQTRNKLQRMVGACRRLLTDEFDDQLQGLYGIYAQDGRVLDLEKLTTLDDDHYQIATLLRDRLKHLTSGIVSEKQPLAEAVRRVLREQAFTVLNRFAALRMAEERGFVKECVGQGLKSKGFQVFETVARSGLGGAYERYVTFIHGIFDEFSLDLGVLFDRWSPFSLLFPREPALLKFFDLLNDAELKPLWKEDETIGWIYQYFNDEAERKKMREESAAPRNSRELAVRNQFFTPRYVVEFLTDNTLGRIWYEMTQGSTKLKEQCRYLVRRPTEIFLKPGEKAPEQPKQDNLSQEELLKQPVHIQHRPLKDPRTILMLDPACGSMHFGLYAFDLFEVIYEEGWELEKRGAEFHNRPPDMLSLHETYGTKEDFLKDVPRLIIEHNLHGIDIDPRCAQIAGLSLWLRAQMAWQRFGLKPAERPTIKRSNIVCAEPMPGEKELLGEFVEREFPAEERGVCLRLMEAIFDKMQLAGEAGSLLKIEEEIRSAIEDARRQWQTARERPEFFEPGQLAALDTRAGAQQELPAAERASMTSELRSLTSEDFWARVEERIYATLKDYAEQAENGGGFQRRLFADDAARGFAFIDVCRKRYDVVLMNPPFGTSSESAKDYVFSNFAREKIELGACFIGAHLKKLATKGCIGVIANRTMLFSRTFEDWRRNTLSGLLLCADLGHGVLDALVETAAFTVSNHDCSLSSFFKLLDAPEKASALQGCCAAPSLIPAARRAFDRPVKAFDSIDGFIFAYWLPDSLLKKFSTMPKAANRGLVARSGLQTCDNFRFLRLAWEVAVLDRDIPPTWVRLTKGGDYQPFWSDIPLVINWKDEGREIKTFIDQLYGQWSKQIPSVDLYRFPGATYTERTTSAISLRVLPRDCLFDKKGPFVGFPDGSLQQSLMLQFIALSYTTPIKVLIESGVGLRDATASGSPARDYLPSLIERLCSPHLTEGDEGEVREASRACVLRHRDIETLNEASSVWHPLRSVAAESSIASIARHQMQVLRSHLHDIYQAFTKIERRCLSAFGVTDEEAVSLRDILGDSVFQFEQSEFDAGEPLLRKLSNLTEDELVDVVAQSHGMTPATLKQAFVGDRIIELFSFYFRRHPLRILQRLEACNIVPDQQVVSTAERLVSEVTGFVLGRWDIRYATGEKAAPELPDPFAPLPVCPPGQLQNAQGLPITKAESGKLKAENYPVDIPWDGILVDDPNHPLDIERRVREGIEIIFKKSAEAIEHEACEILGVKSLREYFRKPAGFFADHLKRYSKSRRQAPIYWPLSTASGSYTLWIYYHRLTDQTLFQCVNDFVKPKLEEVNRDIERLQSEMKRADGGNRQQREKLEELEGLAIELKDFQDELLRVAGLPYKPNLNDGVLITASPLWQLFRLPKWQKDLKACWEALEAGEYDWAHLAYTIWPDRVKKVCKTDRSIAIAHGLENLCEVKAPEKKAKHGKKKQTTAELELD